MTGVNFHSSFTVLHFKMMKFILLLRWERNKLNITYPHIICDILLFNWFLLNLKLSWCPVLWRSTSEANETFICQNITVATYKNKLKIMERKYFLFFEKEKSFKVLSDFVICWPNDCLVSKHNISVLNQINILRMSITSLTKKEF